MNAYFVPVYAVNEDYREGGSQPPAEKAEYNRIYRETLQAKMSAGTVHVYLLNSDGRPIDSLHVADAAKPGRLLEALEGAIQQLQLKPGKTLNSPKPQSRPPPVNEKDLVLHLVARSLDGRGAWSEFPVENWIALTPAEWASFFPPQTPAPTSWPIDAAVSQKLLTHFYPATENNDVRKNQFEHQRLAATVVTTNANEMLLRIEGSLRMRHDFYHREDGKTVEATIIGYARINPAKRAILGFEMVTDAATYADGNFGIAVRQWPR
ncbi:MAG: hypothetical protein AB1813_13825 [Verrucomicrobiota bacterium]